MRFDAPPAAGRRPPAPVPGIGQLPAVTDDRPEMPGSGMTSPSATAPRPGGRSKLTPEREQQPQHGVVELLLALGGELAAAARAGRGGGGTGHPAPWHLRSVIGDCWQLPDTGYRGRLPAAGGRGVSKRMRTPPRVGPPPATRQRIAT